MNNKPVKPTEFTPYFSDDMKAKIEAIVTTFETGKKETNIESYSKLTVMNDGKNNSRQITYGIRQTTEQGNLKTLIRMYVNNPKAKLRKQLQPYVNMIDVTPLHNNTRFKTLLIRAGADPIMHATQEVFFDIIYWDPALKFAMDNGFRAPLSMLVIYDSYIHSGHVPMWIREKFPEVPPRRGGDEKAWVKAYVNARHEWLLSKGGLLARTVYRTQCFMEQFQLENWDLTKPVVVEGKDTIV